ncbi:MAG: 6-phosphogluconolactonase [Acidobacteriota bacterium]|nr:6-phosphogluconolactonase [Acidobacteriota bacterium]
MSTHHHVYPDAQKASEACAHAIVTLLEDRLSGESHASLAISGGSTPKLMFPELAKAKLNWRDIHLFWVDERGVPPTDPQSNFLLAQQYLIGPANIPKANVHRIHAELPPDQAAEQYVDDIRSFFNLSPGELPHFDVIHRGIGSEAHTASLFPGEPLIDDRDQIAAAVYVEKVSQWRITLLPGVLLAAQHTVMLVAGADKADAMHAIFEEPYDPKKYPAQISAHHGRSVTWFLDEAAARLMT